MVLKVEIISKETIKPSSPTPIHLRSFKFSLLDQFTSPIPYNIFFFYPYSDGFDNVKRSDRLKKSLSETLTHFYPLAGTISDNLTVQCDDYGVQFLETKVNWQLSEVLKHHEDEIMKQFFPAFGMLCNELGKGLHLAIQINMFDCGGMVIGITVSHKILDVGSLTTFMNAWARTARGTDETLVPSFDSASLFPPKQVSGSTFIPMKMDPDLEKIVTKKFVFDASNIAALRVKASHPDHVKNPTRVESVLAFLWKCVLKVGDAKSKQSVVNVIVNFRSRIVPPLPENSFGNLVGMAETKMTSPEEAELHYLAGNLRDTIRKINSEYVKELQEGGSLRSTLEEPEQLNNDEVEVYSMSSWCRFPFYEVDFGWGKPIWVCSSNFLFNNGFMLMDTRCESGVEAWVSLDEHKMAEFESELDRASRIYFTCTKLVD